MTAVAEQTRGKTGLQLLAHLKNTGTGPDRLKLVQQYLDENEGASGQEVFDYLYGSQVARGTLEKCGRFLHGDAYRLVEAHVSQGDEAARLAEQLEDVKRQLAEKSAENVRLLKENAHQRGRIAELSGQLQGTRLASASARPSTRSERRAESNKPENQAEQ